MSRRTQSVDEMMEIKLYCDVNENTTAENLIISRYNEFIGKKMPGAKRYVVILSIPKPELFRPDRIMYEEVKEIE